MARILRHLLVYLLILGVWASSSGFSLMAVQLAGELGHATGEPSYPCAGSDCGCTSAAICLTSCTCFPSTGEPDDDAASCCDSADEPSGQRACAISQPACPSDAGHGDDCDDACDKPRGKPASDHTPRLQAPSCGGTHAWLMAQGASVSVPKPPEIVRFGQWSHRLLPGAAESYLSQSDAPEPPPPRF